MLKQVQQDIASGDLIGQVLLDVGYISLAQLAEATARQEACPGKRLGAVLVELGYLSPVRLEKGLALQELEREVRTRRITKKGLR
jgi:hypothetical protein